MPWRLSSMDDMTGRFGSFICSSAAVVEASVVHAPQLRRLPLGLLLRRPAKLGQHRVDELGQLAGHVSVRAGVGVGHAEGGGVDRIAIQLQPTRGYRGGHHRAEVTADGAVETRGRATRASSTGRLARRQARHASTARRAGNRLMHALSRLLKSCNEPTSNTAWQRVAAVEHPRAAAFHPLSTALPAESACCPAPPAARV